MTKERLEALSEGCLFRLADNEMVDYDEDVSKEELILLVLEALEEKREERFLQNNHPIRVEETKFYVSQDEELSAMEEPLPESEIPPEVQTSDLFLEDKLMLILRGPSWAYAYWELTPATRAGILQRGENYQLYLRCYEVDGDLPTEDNVIDYFDIPLQDTNQSRYINLAHPGSVYRAEIVVLYEGNTQGEDEIFSLVRSNPVRPPHNYIALGEGSSLSPDEDWAADQLAALSGLGEAGLSSLDLSRGDGSADSRRIISLEGAELLMKVVDDL